MRLRELRHPKDRLLALSDGVFAVAMTLMSIDVVTSSRGEFEGQSLGEHLISQWPVYTAYVIGFLTVLVCWINHQVVYEPVESLNTGLVWINGLQMALVAAVPMPTALLAEHLTDEGSQLAFSLYGVTFMLMALSFFVTASHIRRRQLAPEADSQLRSGLIRCYGLAVAWTVVCLIVCQFSLVAAIAMWAVMFAVFAFPMQFAAFIAGRARIPAART